MAGALDGRGARAANDTGNRGVRRARAVGIRLSAVMIAIVVVLGLVEIGFRMAGYQPIHRTYSKPDLFWRHDPLLGWSQQPGARGTFVGPRPFPVEFRTPVRINSIGLRGGEVAALELGKQRVLLLGDSFAAGFEVAEDKTYAELLEKSLGAELGQPVEVVNAGVRGYGTDQAYLYYQAQGRLLNAGLVVLHATRNDPEDNTTLHRMRRPFGKPAFALRPDGSLELLGRPVPRYQQCSAYQLDARFRRTRTDSRSDRAFCRLQTRLTDHSAFVTFATTRLQRHPGVVKRIYNLGTPNQQTTPAGGEDRTAGPAPTATSPRGAPPPPGTAPPPPMDHGHALTSALIRRLAATVREQGARFVLLSDGDELARLDRPAFAADGLDVIQVDQAQAPDRRAGHFSDGHLNELGHRRLAEFIAPNLVAKLRR